MFLEPGHTTVSRTIEDSTRDAAEVVAQIAARLNEQISGVAQLDLHYEPDFLGDLTVQPTVPGAAELSLVGVGAGLVLRVGGKGARVWTSSKNIDYVWEIENNSAGVKELETLISDAI